MDLSKDLGFLSGALASVSGICLVPEHQSSLKLDLDSFHAITLQWAKTPSAPTPDPATPVVSKFTENYGKAKEEIFVKTLSGLTVRLFVNLATESVDELKAKIEETERIHPSQQRLIFSGKQLECGKMLRDYGIEQGMADYFYHQSHQ